MTRGLIVFVLCCGVAARVAAQELPLPIATAAGPVRASADAPVVDLTLRFDAGVPPVLEIVRFGGNPGDPLWRIGERIHRDAAAGHLTVHGPAGIETLLLIRAAAHAGYLLVGPFRWPAEPATSFVSARWLKTVRGRSVRGEGPITWVGLNDAVMTARPVCSWTSEADWECVGVPLDSIGVVVLVSHGQVRCNIPAGAVSVEGVQPTEARTATWGRLLVVSAGDSRESGFAEVMRVTPWRLQVPRARPQSIRLQEVRDERIRIDRVGSSAVWVSGTGVPGNGWIEIAAKGRATERIDLEEVAGAPADLPLRIELQPSGIIYGRVTAGAGRTASGAVVTLYRFLHDPQDRDKPQKKRVTVAEVSADEDGAFRFDDLAIERYEIVAMHPALGRGARQVDADGTEVAIALRRPSHAIGRVVRDGVPAAGVRVAVVPDLAQFAAAEDITELRGGETKSNRDGRFTVALASRGSGELRVGDEAAGVRRVPLGPAESQPQVVDVGTIEIGALPPLTLVLEGSEACDLLLIGPAGRTGMTVVRATRLGPAMHQAAVPEPGRWNVVAVCNRHERAVVPASVDVTAGAHDVTVRLMWPQQQ